MEEVGELALAIRKQSGGRLDKAKNYDTSVEEELADVFIYVLSLANISGVDLFKALKEKEARNFDRQWETMK